MAVARVTPGTSLALVRQLTTDLRRHVGDAGSLTAAPKLPRQIEDLLTACAPSAPLVVEVWLDNASDPTADATWLIGAPPSRWSSTAQGRQLAEASIEGRPIQLVYASSGNPVVWASGEPAASLIVWEHAEAGAPVADDTDDRPVLHVVSSEPAVVPSAREQRVIARSAPDGVLARLLGGTKDPLPEILHADNMARALEALAAIAGLALAQEGRGIRAKRTLAQQRVATVQARTPAQLGEVLGGLRTRLQRVFVDFSRGLDDRFVTAFTAPSAPFWQTLDERLQQFDRIDQEPRVKTMATRLPKESESAWLETVRSAVRAHGVADLSAMRDMLRAEAAEVERAVVQAGGPPVTVQLQALTDERLERLLDQYVAPQRAYQGELPRPGFFEYMMIARRYQTVAFMLLSAFGLSFLRTYREFMLPATVLLLSLGALQVIQSVRKERVESVQKELDKIRELLRGESKRMVSELQRAWVPTLSQHLSDQLPLVLSQMETSVKEHFARQASDGADERQRLQRQLQALEVSERKLIAPDKGREAVAQAVANVRGELRQLVAAALRAGQA